jgi:hypothetical protein
LKDERRWWIPVLMIPVVVLMLQFPVSLAVWNLLPKLRLLQFPWRWLVVLEAPMAVVLAAAVWPVKTWARIAVGTVFAVAFVAATAFANEVLFQWPEIEDSVPGLLHVFRTGAGFDGTDEYAPPGADNTIVATGLPDSCLVHDPMTVLGKPNPDTNPAWYASDGSCIATYAASHWPEHLRIRAVTADAGYLVLKLRRYPAWRVRVNGAESGSLSLRQDGLMAVPVPRGAVDLTVDWTATGDAIVGRWVSGLGLALVAILFAMEMRLRRAGKV